MGVFKNTVFTNEFAYRTKMNYYRALFENTNDLDEKKRVHDIITDLETQMENDKYEIASFYEVTQLINSLIGLLVFPEQTFFESLSEKGEVLEEKYPVLYSIVNSGPSFFVSTYRVGKFDEKWNGMSTMEQISPKSIVKHMKNAVSHSRIMIHPENGHISNTFGNQIKAIIFEDIAYYNCWLDDHGNVHWKMNNEDDDIKAHSGPFRDFRVDSRHRMEHFFLKVPIDKLEALLMEICDVILHDSRWQG